MRSKEQIEKELNDAKEQLKLWEKERADYNGDSGAERYLFLTSIGQRINGTSDKVRKLSDELEEYSKNQFTLS